MKVTILLACACSAPLFGTGVLAAQANDTSAAVVSWIRENAAPLRHLQAGNGFADLAPLEAALHDVRIVGLGEATHGTREFFQVKYRLVEFLVTRMGFTAFALEAAYSDAQPINDYIVHGRGDRASVLTGQGYVAWDTEEFAAMLDWMRSYNQTVPDDRKVRFYGLDLYRNETGRTKTTAFLRRTAPEAAAAVEGAFRSLAQQETQWPQWDTTEVARTRPALDSLATFLANHRISLPPGPDRIEVEDLIQDVRVMQQAVSLGGRTIPMFDNLLAILDRERPGTKIAIWAHNGHVGNWVSPDGERAIGHILRRRFGSGYYALGLEFGEGSYLVRDFPDGDLRALATGPPEPGSFPDLLLKSGVGDLFLDLRPAPQDPRVFEWLRTRRPMHSINWGHPDPEQYEFRDLAATYDGIIFVTRSNPTRPTPNARENAAERRSF